MNKNTFDKWSRIVGLILAASALAVEVVYMLFSLPTISMGEVLTTIAIGGLGIALCASNDGK